MGKEKLYRERNRTGKEKPYGVREAVQERESMGRDKINHDRTCSIFVKISVMIGIIFDQGHIACDKGHVIQCSNGSLCWCSHVYTAFLLHKT